MTEHLLDRQTDRRTGTEFLQLTFLMSAYNTAQRMIWFSDQKANYIVIYYGILLSILGTRVDHLLSFFRSPAAALAPRAALIFLGLGFLTTMIVSLVYSLQTVVPTYLAPVDVPEYKRLYWCHDILAKDVETYYEALRGLDGEGLTKEMTRELYSAVAIERVKFERVTRSLKAGVASFVVWLFLFGFALFV